MLIKAPERECRTWGLDSNRWENYRPRPDDIVIATHPKCGTTWMQRIVSLLVFQSPEPRPIMHISPWIDCRFKEPIEVALARIEAQEHRRFLKSCWFAVYNAGEEAAMNTLARPWRSRRVLQSFPTRPQSNPELVDVKALRCSRL